MSDATRKKVTLIMACGLAASSLPVNVFAGYKPDSDQGSGDYRTTLTLIKKTEDNSNQTVLTIDHSREDDSKTNVTLKIKREEAPTGMKEYHISVIGSKDGGIESIPAETEYRIGEEGEWLPVPDGGELTELGTGTVYIRNVSKVKGFPAGNSIAIEIKSDFADAKEIRKSECKDMMFKKDSETCLDILSNAIRVIEDLLYNKNITLEENIAVIEDIKTQFETDLIAQRKTEYEAQFEEFKNLIIEEIDKMVREDDSDDAKQLIELTRTEIKELEYDHNLELIENKENAESLMINLIVDLDDQRGTDRHEAFETLVEYYVNKYDERITEETSEALKSIINEGKENLHSLECDDKKSISENKVIIETIVRQINDRIEIQTESEEDAAAASEVEAKIALLSEAEYTEDFYNKVKEAEDAYKRLSEKQQNLVTNYSVYEDAEKALEEVYDVWRVVKEATCVENGIEEMLTHDGKVKTQPTPAKGGHKYGAWTIKELATDEKDGKKERVCKTCGAIDTAPTQYDWHDEGESQDGKEKAGTISEKTEPDKNALHAETNLSNKDVIDSVPLSLEELNNVENGKNLSIKLDVKDITGKISEEAREKYEKDLGKYEHLGVVLDITVEKYLDDVFIGTVQELKKPIAIAIEIPDSIYSKDRDFSIVCEHESQLSKIALEPIEGRLQGYSFGSKDFSTYYITYVDNKEAADTIINKTNDIKKDITEFDDSTEAIQKILDETKQAKEDFAELTDKQKNLVTNDEDLEFIENICEILIAEKNIADEAEAARINAENKEADAQAALNEANEKTKAAVIAKEIAENAALEAQNELDIAEQTAAKAENALAEAEKNAAEALTAQAAAEKEADAAIAAQKKAQINASEALAAQTEAEKELAAAKEAQTEAEKKASEAQAAMKAAEKDAEYAASAKEDAEKDIETAKEALEAAKKEAMDAITALADAQKAAENAKADKEKAEKAAKENIEEYNQAVIDLAEAEKLIDKLKEEAEAAAAAAEASGTNVNNDQSAAEVVIALIKDIKGIVRTAECKDSIVSARSAYEKLTETQKALVINYNILLKAEEEYAALPEELPQTGFSGIHNALAGFAALMTTAGAVILKKRRKADEEE